MDLARSLNEQGNQVDVYMFSGNNYTDEKGINYISLDLFGKNKEVDEYVLQENFGSFENEEAFDLLARRMESLISSSNYDIMQLNSQLFLKCWTDSKRIFTIHTNPFEFEFAWGISSFKTMLEIMKVEGKNKLTTFVLPSNHYKLEYEQLTQIPMIFIPHAIDINRLICNVDKENILQKYYLKNNRINILLPSRLEPVQKQPMIFMEACAKLEKNIKEQLQVICTGLDKQYEKYANEIKKYSIENGINIKILRFDNISEAYSIANLVVLPSKSESFGYSALESLSSGITTIMNNIPTFNEIALNNQKAYIFDYSSDNLYEILKTVLNENNLDRELPNKSWQEQYDLYLWSKKYLGVFKDGN